jgi:hypothetical protein
MEWVDIEGAVPPGNQERRTFDSGKIPPGKIPPGKILVPLDKQSSFKINGNDARFFHRNHLVPSSQCLVLFMPKSLMSWEDFIDEVGLLPAFSKTSHPHTQDLPSDPYVHDARSLSSATETTVGMTMGVPAAVSDFEAWLSSIQSGTFFGGRKTRPKHRKRGRK